MNRRVRRIARIGGHAALAAAKGITIALVVDSVLRPEQPKYRGKAMRIRALGYGAGLLIVPVAWAAGGRQEDYPIAADLAVTFPLLIDAAGNALGIYDEARIDDLVHGVNAAALSWVFGSVVGPRLPSREAAAVATLAFGLVGELLFDGMEYVGERLGFDGLGLSPEDTIADVAAASIGASLASALTWIRWRDRAGARRVGPRPDTGLSGRLALRARSAG